MIMAHPGLVQNYHVLEQVFATLSAYQECLNRGLLRLYFRGRQIEEVLEDSLHNSSLLSFSP